MKKKKISIPGIIKWIIALLLVIMQVYPFFYVFTSHNNLCFSLVNSLFLTFSFFHRDCF